MDVPQPWSLTIRLSTSVYQGSMKSHDVLISKKRGDQ